GFVYDSASTDGMSLVTRGNVGFGRRAHHRDVRNAVTVLIPTCIMSNYEFLLYNVRQGVATVCLNRPKVYNALNDVVTYELQDVFKAIERNDDVRVVVLTGSGKAFCSGQDLKEAVEPGKKSFRESLHKRYNPIIRAMRALPKPIICRLNGVA